MPTRSELVNALYSAIIEQGRTPIHPHGYHGWSAPEKKAKHYLREIVEQALRGISQNDKSWQRLQTGAGERNFTPEESLRILEAIRNLQERR